MAKRIKSRDDHKGAARAGRHAVYAALMLIFVGAVSLSDGKLLPDFLTGRASVPTRVATESAPRTGSVVVSSRDGSTCEHRILDNETWRIRSDGAVDCATPSHRRPYGGRSRIEVIRDGFVAKR